MFMQNNSLYGATRILSNLGMREAARDLNDARVPVGIATTVASAVEGNPRAARSVIGSVAREYDSPALNTAMRFGGIGAMMSMFQNVIPSMTGMFSGMSGGVLGNLGNSGALAMQGNMPGNPLAKSFTGMGGIYDSKIPMMSVDPESGMTSRWGASAPAAPSYAPNPNAGVSGPSALEMGMRRQPGLIS